MSAEHSKSIPEAIEFEIDRSSPIATGASIGDGLLMPVMRHLEAGMPEHRDRVHLWTGLFAATLGMMAASVGPDDAEVIYQGLRGAFDEARKIESVQAAAPANGVH